MKPDPVSNRTLTLLRKLNQKKYRQREQLFLIEGARAVQQVLENGSLEVQELFFDEGQEYWLQQQWSARIQRKDALIIDSKTFAEVSDTDNPQGVIALCRMPEEADPGQLAQRSGLILATDAIQDPGNLGTIIRTAGWFGVQGLLSGKGTADLFHPKVVRSTAGATGTVSFLNGDLKEILPVFEEAGWQIVLLDAGAESKPLREIERNNKVIIVVGNEANGVDSALFAESRIKARIPSPGDDKKVESLNAAIAASIALYALS